MSELSILQAMREQESKSAPKKIQETIDTTGGEFPRVDEWVEKFARNFDMEEFCSCIEDLGYTKDADALRKFFEEGMVKGVKNVKELELKLDKEVTRRIGKIANNIQRFYDSYQELNSVLKTRKLSVEIEPIY